MVAGEQHGGSGVTLRPLRFDDWPAVHDWARLPAASHYQVWGPNSEDQTRAFVTEAVQAGPDRPSYAAVVDGEVRGLGQLLVTSRAHRAGEIRYIVHPELWGRGIGTAIGSELLRMAFDEHRLHRVVATCDPRNTGSARVLAKLGMRYEGRLRHTRLLADGWRDSDLYSVLEDERGQADPS